MGQLAESAFSAEALRLAWEGVLEADRADGVLSSGIQHFGQDVEGNIAGLAASLATLTYKPAELFIVEIPKDEGTRTLSVPPPRDRVVARALLRVLTPLVDPLLGPAAYAYRPGLGVRDAVDAVAALRDEGMHWVLRTDIDDCFPTIPVTQVRRLMREVVGDGAVLAVVDKLLARYGADHRGHRRPVTGLAQGCPLSPLLANLVLAQVDTALLDAGFAVSRYADDIVIVADSREEALEAKRQVAKAVEGMGMKLGTEDTEVMSFEEGFTFLGEDFGPKYPLAQGSVDVEEPTRKVVYVALQGCRVHVMDGRLRIESANDEPVLNVPTGHVSRVVCFGSVGVSAGLRSWAFASDVDLVFASRRGSYMGSFVAEGGGTRVDRLKRQIAAQDSPESLVVGRAILEAKIRKQIVVLQRFGRRQDADEVHEAVNGMRRMLLLLPDAKTPEELMGLEGAAAAAYFPAYGSLMPEEVRFSLRSRRPPLDVANAALSFLYTVLVGECVTALWSAGLDPGIGILHANHDHRPSLALDLIEEFRPLIVDQVVLELARQSRLTLKHARTEEGRVGVLLTKAGRTAVLEAYEHRMLTYTRGALPDFAGTLRRHLYRQAQRLEATIISPDEHPWTGLGWR